MPKKLPKWLPAAAWGVAIILTAFLIGQLGSLYLRQKWNVPKKISLAQEQSQATPKAQQRSFAEYNTEILPILGNKTPDAPGGKNSAKGAKKPAEPGEIDWDQVLSASPQSIILTGTVIGDDTAIAFVTVNNVEASLKLGQSAGEYTVDAISKNKVIFRKDSITKTISMFAAEEPPAPDEGGAAVSPGPSAVASGEPDLNGIVKPEGDKYVVDRKQFNDLLKPPSRLAGDIKFIPNAKDGTPYGIKISYLKPDSFFTKVGLQSGDVLVKTNKKDLQSVEDSFYAYQAFKNEDHLTLEVDRNGQIIKIPIDFR